MRNRANARQFSVLSSTRLASSDLFVIHEKLSHKFEQEQFLFKKTVLV
jgi:hypothetical protein